MTDLCCRACGNRAGTGPVYPPTCACGGLWDLSDPGPQLSGTRRPEVPLCPDPVRPHLWWKREDLQATGSFKDRGARSLARLALSVGARSLVVDSSGSAALAAAAAGAATGLPVTVHVPERMPGTIADSLGLLNARIIARGTRENAAARARADARESFYASHVHHPVFAMGTARSGLEVLDEPGQWASAPDRWVVPVGNGSLLLGLYSALRHRRRTDVQIIAVQAAACPGLQHPGRGGATRSRGIAIADPPRRRQILEAIEATGGRVILVEEAEIDRARTALGARGISAEHAAATAEAALDRLRADEGGRPAVAWLTGSALRDL